jgi:hypothetical protein
MREAIRNRIGSLLGYGGCDRCGYTFWRYNDDDWWMEPRDTHKWTKHHELYTMRHKRCYPQE